MQRPPPPPPPDLAQVVLRALLAWPLVGLSAGFVAAGVVERLGGQAAPALLAFAAGAGAGAGVAFALAELAVAATRARGRPALAPWAGVAALAAGSPLLLLGGDFAALRVTEGSTAAATRALALRLGDAPWAALDLDAALAVLWVGAPLLAARAAGRPPVTQAAAAATCAVLGLLARLLCGWLTSAPLSLLAAVDLAVACLAPWTLAAADRVVAGARRALAGRAQVHGGEEGAWRWRLAAPLAQALAPTLVAAAWCVAGAVARGGRRGALTAGDALGVALLGAALLATPAVAHRRGASRRALLGAAAAGATWAALAWGGREPRLVAAFAATSLGAAALAPALAGLAARARDLARRADVGRPAPGARRRARAALAAALGVAALLVLPWPGATGALVRLRLGAALPGGDAMARLRWAEALARDADPGQRRSLWFSALEQALALPYVPVEPGDDLLRRAAAAGDVPAARALGLALSLRGRGADAGEGRGWLRRAAAAGDVVAAGLLLADDARDARAGLDPGDAACEDLVLAAARRGDPAAGGGLAALWRARPARRREVEALLLAGPAWEGEVDDLLWSGDAPAFVDAALTHRRAQARDGRDPAAAARLYDLLAEHPDRAAPGDGLASSRCTQLSATAADLAALADLDLRPPVLAAGDGAGARALRAAAAGDWPAAWALARDGLADGARDEAARAALGLALLAEARGAPPATPVDGSLELARLLLSNAPWSFAPELLYTRALAQAHRALVEPLEDVAHAHADLDAVAALAPDAAPRLERLRAVLVATAGVPDAEGMRQARAALASDLRAAAGEDPDRAAQLERAADALEALR